MSKFGRRTWDKEEYAKLAAEGETTHEQSLKSSLTETQLQQLKVRYTDYNSLMQNAIQNLNKRYLATGVSSFKRGKQFGFYCELCNFTFKDTLQYIDHLNHKTHQIKFEAIFDEPLVNETRDNDEISSEEFEEKYHDMINQFLKTHSNKIKKVDDKLRQKQVSHKRILNSKSPNPIESAMGFSAFGTSKK